MTVVLKAFGDSFEQNVTAVANAVEVMGKNMDKINENISLQKQLLSTLKSDEIVKGLDKYIEASNHFVSITKSLNKFEEARRMLLANLHRKQLLFKIHIPNHSKFQEKLLSGLTKFLIESRILRRVFNALDRNLTGERFLVTMLSMQSMIR